jgi:beta-glucosidase-like glycosyl hydrolase
MVELGLRAGIDIFLICHTQEKWEKAWTHLLKLSENERDRTRIFESANRVMRLKNEMLSSWSRPWRPNAAMLDEIGSQKHLEVMRHVPSLQVGKDPTEAN